jgi:hypothetical protein
MEERQDASAELLSSSGTAADAGFTAADAWQPWLLWTLNGWAFLHRSFGDGRALAFRTPPTKLLPWIAAPMRTPTNPSWTLTRRPAQNCNEGKSTKILLRKFGFAASSRRSLLTMASHSSWASAAEGSHLLLYHLFAPGLIRCVPSNGQSRITSDMEKICDLILSHRSSKIGIPMPKPAAHTCVVKKDKTWA